MLLNEIIYMFSFILKACTLLEKFLLIDFELRRHSKCEFSGFYADVNIIIIFKKE